MSVGSYYYNNSYTIPGTYNYHIWANDTSGNSNISSVYQFTISIMEYDYSIPLDDRWNLVSLPVNQSVHKDNITVNYLGVNYTWQQAVDNGTILNFVYGWNTVSQSYASTDVIGPGESYWVYAYNACNLWVSGPINNDDYITNLFTKWNLIGLPFNTSIDKINLTITNNSIDYTWQQAVDNGTILNFVYGWNTVSQSYASTDILNPGYGYWMYAYYNCTLKR
jgi:hypothetical protein